MSKKKASTYKKRDTDSSVVRLDGRPAPGALPTVEEAQEFKPIPRRRDSKIEVQGVEIRRQRLPLWQKRWSAAWLRDKRTEMGPREFDRGYRQMAIAEGDLLFDLKALDRALDRSLVLPHQVEKGSPFAEMRRDAGVDLNMAAANPKPGEEGAFFAIAGEAADPKDQLFYLIHFERTREITPGQQLEAIKGAHRRFLFDCIMVESNAYQRSVVRHFQEEELEFFPVEPYHTSEHSKIDLQLGIPGLALEFSHDRWRIPYGDERTKRIVEPLIEELRSYPTPGPTYDGLMALFFAREGRRRAWLSGANNMGIRVINL